MGIKRSTTIHLVNGQKVTEIWKIVPASENRFSQTHRFGMKILMLQAVLHCSVIGVHTYVCVHDLFASIAYEILFCFFPDVSAPPPPAHI